MSPRDARARRALVTGAGQGIGAAIARRLTDDGFDVVVVDLRQNAASAVAAGLGATAHTLDVIDFDAAARLADLVGPVDVVVNNAGIWRLARLADATEDDLRAVVEVNLIGTIAITKAFAPGLASLRGSSIVNISSGAARTASPGLGSYAASKAAVETLTRQWAQELAPIRVNAVAPGLIETEGTEENYRGEAGRRRAAAVPVGRTGHPEDVAAVVSFLVGEAAGYVNGQVITVDGGLSAGVGAH